MGRVRPVDSTGSTFSKPIPKHFSIAKQKQFNLYAYSLWRASLRCRPLHLEMEHGFGGTCPKYGARVVSEFILERNHHSATWRKLRCLLLSLLRRARARLSVDPALGIGRSQHCEFGHALNSRN